MSFGQVCWDEAQRHGRSIVPQRRSSSSPSPKDPSHRVGVLVDGRLSFPELSSVDSLGNRKVGLTRNGLVDAGGPLGAGDLCRQRELLSDYADAKLLTSQSGADRRELKIESAFLINNRRLTMSMSVAASMFDHCRTK
jgi:hypothetical protein